MNREERIKQIREQFLDNSKTLVSISDINRQQILLVLMDYCKKGGTRVENIAVKVNLSRPAVSHHLKILKDDGIISLRKEGTKNYYYISGYSKILKLKDLLENIEMLVNEEGNENDG